MATAPTAAAALLVGWLAVPVVVTALNERAVGWWQPSGCVAMDPADGDLDLYVLRKSTQATFDRS